MPVAWEALSELVGGRKGMNPSIDAIIGVAEALDRLGKDKPLAKGEAQEKLEDVARQVIGKGSKSAVQSLMKKVARLDSFLNSGDKKFHRLFRAWLNDKIDRNAWAAMIDECEPKMLHLRAIAESVHRLLQPDRTGTTITVETTRILSSRFWASVLAEFYRRVESDEKKKDTVHVDIVTREPYMLIREGDAHASDLVLTYRDANAETAKKWEKRGLKFAELHRCVLFPLRTDNEIPSSFSYDVFNGQRVALLSDANLVSPQFRWDEMRRRASDVAYRQSHIELHAYVRGQCGLAVSCLEFLDELDEKELQYLEIPGDEGGNVYLVCASRKNGDASMTPHKTRWLKVLLEIVANRIDTIESNHKLATKLTEYLRQYNYSYSTTGVRVGKKQESHARRGRISLQVTPNLLVHGSVILDRAPLFPDKERCEAEKYRLFGRVQLSNESQAQLVLRAMSDDGREISMTSFVLEVSPKGVCTPGLSEPCLVGHWLGRERANPNAGAWILHSRADLRTADVKKIIGQMAKLYPLSLYPSETTSLVRFGELH